MFWAERLRMAENAAAEQFIAQVVEEAQNSAKDQVDQLTLDLAEAREQLSVTTEQRNQATTLYEQERVKTATLSDDLLLAREKVTMLEGRITSLDATIADLRLQLAQAGGNDRENLVRGQYIPGPTTTGPTHPSRLVKVTGIQIFDVSKLTAPVVIKDKHYLNTVQFIGSSPHRMTFINCFAGGKDEVAGSKASIVGHNAGVRDIVWIDSEVSVNHQIPGDPANVHHMKFIRCSIWGGIDGVGIWNAHDENGVLNGPGVHYNEVELWDCWIHDQLFLSPFPSQWDNKSHSDGVHVRGGTNTKIVGCLISAYYTQGKGNASEPPRVDNTDPTKPKHLGGNPLFPKLNSACCIQISDDYGAPRNLVVEYNHLPGGTTAINGATGGGGYIGSISYNWFYPSTYINGPTWGFMYSTGAKLPLQTFKYEGNINAETGAAMTAARRGDY